MTASKESDDKVLALWGREPAQKVAVCVALFSACFYLVAAIAALAFFSQINDYYRLLALFLVYSVNSGLSFWLWFEVRDVFTRHEPRCHEVYSIYVWISLNLMIFISIKVSSFFIAIF